MIEMVYRGTSKDGKGKERTGLPKNIRQIGDAGSDKRVYIEDYVITFLEKTGCAVLLGEVWQNENMKCLFADGAVEIAEGEPNDDMWEKIYREMKQYFPGREVIGWAKKMEEPEEEPDEKLFDLHREQFPGEDKLLFLYDSEENASVFLTENTGIRKQSGYYIYYEKNEQMQSYMVKENEGQSVEAEAKNQDGAIQNFRRRIAKKQQDAQNVEQEQKSKTPTMVRFLYGASMFLVLTILVIGATMVNNYNRMKDMEVTLQEMALGSDGQSSDLSKETEKQKETDALAASAQAEGENTKESTVSDETEKTWILKESSTESNAATESNAESAGTAAGRAGTAGSSTAINGTGSTGMTGGSTESTGTTGESSQNLSTESSTGSSSASNRAASSSNVTQYQAEYTVRDGDTLAIVCRMYYGNLDKLQEICDLNGITDPNTILPGQKIVLP